MGQHAMPRMPLVRPGQWHMSLPMNLALPLMQSRLHVLQPLQLRPPPQNDLSVNGSVISYRRRLEGW